MISKLDLENLLRYEGKPESPVISVYLNVDQSRAANLNRGFEVVLKNMLRSMEQQLDDEHKRREFAADAESVHRFVSEYDPKARSLVIFCDQSDGFFWRGELNTPLVDDVQWSGTPHVRPLLQALREFERYGVIVADRARARLFTVFLGEIQEHREVFAPGEIKHTKTAGTDHIWSQTRFQRKADGHARWHLKHVAESMDHLASFYAFDRLVLAGPLGATSELYRLLPKRLRSGVVSSIALPVEGSEQQVLEATLKIEEKTERASEIKLVEELITAAAKKGYAVTGLDATLTSLKEGRIWQLVYADGFAPQSSQCTHCSTLFSEGQTLCAYCDGPLRPVDHLIGRLTDRVVDLGGKIEQVHGEAAARLQKAGGVGAFLRF